MKLTYAEQLKHPNWQRVRLEMLAAADFRCSVCGDAESTLHVHHKQYIKGRMAWEYEAAHLEVLCEGCHEYAHLTKAFINETLATLPSVYWDQIASLLSGWAGYQGEGAPQGGPLNEEIGKLAAIAGNVLRLGDVAAISSALQAWDRYEDLTIVLKKHDKNAQKGVDF